VATDFGTVAASVLAAELKLEKLVGFRLALRKEADWIVYAMLLEVNVDGTGLNWTCYDYGDAAFVAGNVSGAEASAWLGGPGSFSIEAQNCGACMFKMQEMLDPGSWWKLPSHTTYGLSEVPRPYKRYTINAANRTTSPSGFLLAEGCPFFPDFDTAVRELLFGMSDPSRTSGQEYNLVTVHIARPEAWIEQVHLAPSSINVTVEGDRVEGARLDIRGLPDTRQTQPLAHPGSVEFAMPNGIPSQPWIVLARGHDWLDYRYLGSRMLPFAPKTGNITIAAPDTRTRVEEALSRGEGPQVEFKRQLPENHDKILKTVAAFANAEGGVVLIGVNDSDGMVVGLTGNVAREKDLVTQIIHDKVVPEPDCTIEQCEIDGSHVIAVFVERGAAKPYGLNPAKPEYYVRRGATTFPARQEEVRELARGDGTPGDATYVPGLSGVGL